MKTIKLFLLSFVVLAALTVLLRCDDKVISTRTYTLNIPIYQSAEEIRQSVRSETFNDDNVEFESPGKIFFKESFLYVNQPDEGVIVIDDSDPASPKKVAFITIPGNFDIAISGNILYADSYTDLVMLDISDIENISEVNRIEDILSTTQYGYNDDYGYETIDTTKGMVVGWIQEQVTKEIDYVPGTWIDSWGVAYSEDGASISTSNTTKQSGSTGQAGSMSRFMLYRDYLYTLSEYYLQPFDISDRKNPQAEESIYMGSGMETLFLYESSLFVGTQTGMLIYSLDNPTNPGYIGSFTHATACDPVVVEDDIAYVTLRAGTECDGTDNELDVIDVSNMYNPELIKEYELYGPYGLGIDDGTLFVCDGDDGLKIYSAKDPENIANNLIKHYDDISTYDVIPWNGILMLSGEDGIYQYDYTDLSDIKLLSTLKIN